MEEPPPRLPLLCIEIISDERFSEVQKRCDDYIAEGVTQVWLLAPNLKRAYTATKTEGLREFKGEILQIANPPLEMDLRRIFDYRADHEVRTREALGDASGCGMYPLTIGLAIGNRELRDQTQSCLANLPFRVIVEHQDIAGDLVSFLDRLEHMRPDVVLIDISAWKEPLQGLVASIRNAVGDPMIIALLNAPTVETTLAAMRAGVHDILFPPLQEPLRRALEKRSG